MIRYLINNLKNESVSSNFNNIIHHVELIIKNDCNLILSKIMNMFNEKIIINDLNQCFQIAIFYLSIDVIKYLLLNLSAHNHLSNENLDDLKIKSLDQLLEIWKRDIESNNKNSIINIEQKKTFNYL